jgi:sugar diacid utilization regulator
MKTNNMFYLIKIFDNNEYLEMFYDVLKDIYGINNVSLYLNKSDFVLINNIEDNESMLELVDTLEDDFGLRINCFVGNIKTENYIDFIYRKMINISYKKNNIIFDEGMLLGHIMNENIDDEVKRIILGKYYNDSDMKNTIKVFIESNMNTLKASQILYMHRNTLINKVNKFIDATGYNIREFVEAVIIYNLLK